MDPNRKHEHKHAEHHGENNETTATAAREGDGLGFPSVPTTSTSGTTGNPVQGVIEGRIVHYVMPPSPHYPQGGQHRAAIITNAHGGQLADGTVNLSVQLDVLNDFPHRGSYVSKDGHNVEYMIPDTSTWHLGSVKYSEGKEIGTWHWPERA